MKGTMKAEIIFLNGISISGKSFIAKALQEIIETSCIHWCIDDYLSVYQQELLEKKEIVAQEWAKIIQGFHAAEPLTARGGNSVSMDDVLESGPPWLESLMNLFEGLYVLFVGVRYQLAELERREKERKERGDGMVRLRSIRYMLKRSTMWK